MWFSWSMKISRDFGDKYNPWEEWLTHIHSLGVIFKLVNFPPVIHLFEKYLLDVYSVKGIVVLSLCSTPQ